MMWDMASRADRIAARLRALLSRAAATAAGGPHPSLAAYAEKVRRSSSSVSDEDVRVLREAGVSENTILDATIAAALEEGLARIDAGMSVLRGKD